MMQTKRFFLAALIVYFLFSLFSCKKDEPTSPDTPSDEPSLVEANCNCDPLPAASGKTITVSSADELHKAIYEAEATEELTILLKKGTYNVSNSKFFYIKDKRNITIRSESGKREEVIIKGEGMNAGKPCSGFGITSCKNVNIADLTITNVPNHGVLFLESEDCTIHNVHFININEQSIKGAKKESGQGTKNCIVECCRFEFTAPQANQYYTCAVDVHQGTAWIVRNNFIKNMKSPEDNLCEHAIHFWSNSKDMIIENNTIVNCDRGIGFGMDNSPTSGGIVRNNFIHTTRDVSIDFRKASNVKVYNNTIHTENYANSIEYRFKETTAEIKNNLVNKTIKARDGGTATLEKNYTFNDLSIFKDASKHNYLLTDKAGGDIVDAGTALDDVKTDIECEARPKGSGYDIGADEF